MDRDDTVKSEQLFLTKLPEDVNGADDFQILRPEGRDKWRVIDRDVVHRGDIGFAIWDILFAYDPYARKTMEDSAKNSFEKRANELKLERDMIGGRVAHLTKASTRSNT